MTKQKNSQIRDMTYIALFAVLIGVCAWISIPGPVSFTMQTFGVFMAVGILGGKRGSIAVLLYLLLGMIGMPVFAGFNSGIGALAGPTGGYIVGFLFSALAMWGVEAVCGRKPLTLFLSMVLGLVICYAFGTVWFVQVYTRTKGPMDIISALSACVFPFIIPDLLKIALAMFVQKRLRLALKLA